MTAQELLDEVIEIATAETITRDAAKRFGVLVSAAPDAVQYQVGDMIEVFIKKAMKQDDGEELVAIASGE